MSSDPEVARRCADFDRFDVLCRTGYALGRVKADRRLTLDDVSDVLGRSVDQVSRYIAGEDMPVSIWMKALTAWPELATRFEETAEERAAQGRQCGLNLGEPKRERAS